MDAKNRVTIPSEWASREGEVLYVLPASDSTYLNVMPEDELARKDEELRSRVPDKDYRRLQRAVYGAARRLEPDKQGRALLPDEFCKVANLGSTLTLIGVKNSFEIWDAAKRSNAATTDSGLSPEAKAALEALGL